MPSRARVRWRSAPVSVCQSVVPGSHHAGSQRVSARPGTRSTRTNLRLCLSGNQIPPDPARTRRFVHRPSNETRLQLVGRIGDAYGLVLVLILATFVVTMTLPPEGWVGRLAAVAIAGLTASIALTSSDVPLRRVRLAAGAALAAVLATALARVVSSELRSAPRSSSTRLLAVAAATILRRVLLAVQVDFRPILGRSASTRCSACCSASCSSRSGA